MSSRKKAKKMSSTTQNIEDISEEEDDEYSLVKKPGFNQAEVIWKDVNGIETVKEAKLDDDENLTEPIESENKESQDSDQVIESLFNGKFLEFFLD